MSRRMNVTFKKKDGSYSFFRGEKITKRPAPIDFRRVFKRLRDPSIRKQEKDYQDYCESERPPRKTICQKKKGHAGSCRAVIFWEQRE